VEFFARKTAQYRFTQQQKQHEQLYSIAVLHGDGVEARYSGWLAAIGSSGKLHL